MSSSEIVAIEMAAVGSMLALHAALGGTGVALEGIGNLAMFAADWMREQADSRQARLDAARRYEELVREALDRHARIDALAASAERARRDRGVNTELCLPQPLCFDNLDPGQLEAWCVSTDSALAAAENTLSEAIAQALTTQLMAVSRGVNSDGQVLVTDVAAAERSSGQAERAALAATLTRILSRLSPHIVPADVAAIRAAAARVAQADTTTEAHSRLTDVRVRVQQANKKARAVRADALRAARCLRLLSGYQAPGVDSTRAALAEVLAGRAELDDLLAAQADALAAEAQADRERRYLAATLAAALGDLGYHVGEDFESLTVRNGDVFITRGDWPAHAVKVRLGEEHELRFAIVRTVPSTSRQDQRLDTEREQAWCQSFERIRAVMAQRGMNAAVQWRLEPGIQQLPVARRGVASSRQQVRRHDRERQP